MLKLGGPRSPPRLTTELIVTKSAVGVALGAIADKSDWKLNKSAKDAWTDEYSQRVKFMLSSVGRMLGRVEGPPMWLQKLLTDRQCHKHNPPLKPQGYRDRTLTSPPPPPPPPQQPTPEPREAARSCGL